MTEEMPKSAHRSKEQKALGYINAAREALNNAQFWLDASHPAIARLQDLAHETYEVERLVEPWHGKAGGSQ